MNNATILQQQRAKALDRVDDILRTVKMEGRNLTPAERAEHDAQADLADDLAATIARAGRSDGTGYQPTISRSVPGAGLRAHSLDELLWATSTAVRAGSIANSGKFMPDPVGASNPVERVVVRSDGASYLAPRIEGIHADDRDLVRTFQQTVSDMIVWGLLVDKHARSSADGFEAARSHRAWSDRFATVLRAMDVDTAGEGGTWVPTGIGSSLHEKVRAAGRVAPLFARIDLPTNPWKWPVEGADAIAYRIAEPTSDSAALVTASTPGSNAATFDAEIFGGRTIFSRSVEADSALAIVEYVQGKLVQAFVDAEEMAILSGDTAGTHQDSDVTGTADARTAWDGLRKKGIAQTNTAGGNAALTSTLLRSSQRAMKKWGVNPSDLAHIVSISAHYDLLGDANLLSLDAFGPQATILTGQIGSIGGVPVIISSHMREDLNATGVYDGITTNRSTAITVNRGEWIMGQRMALDVEVNDSIRMEAFQRTAIAFSRADFVHCGDAAANDDTACIVNLAVS